VTASQTHLLQPLQAVITVPVQKAALKLIAVEGQSQ